MNSDQASKNIAGAAAQERIRELEWLLRSKDETIAHLTQALAWTEEALTSKGGRGGRKQSQAAGGATNRPAVTLTELAGRPF